MALTQEDLQKIKQEKLAALRRAFKSIDKQLNQTNSVYMLQDNPLKDIEVISTGSLMVDAATGIGGIPLGKVVSIGGLESSGKSLLALRTIAQAQKKGYVCAFLDLEQSFSPSWAALQGVNVNELVLSQPTIMEDTFNIIIGLIKTGALSLVVVDSISSLVPRAELEDDIEKQHMALVARGLSKFLKIVVPLCAEYNCTLFTISQLRNTMNLYGPSYQIMGGKIRTHVINTL